MIRMLTKPRRLVDERNEIRATCKRLVRYIHENDLHEGDRVPPQEILRRQFGIRHDTLTAAMRTLVQYEVVHRKPKVGTVVVNRDAVIPGLWTVGLLAYDYQERLDNLFLVSLLWALEGYLARAGCQWRTYYRTVNREMEPNRVSDFSGLESDIAAGHIDAVVTPTEVLVDDLRTLQESGIAVCPINFMERINDDIGGVGIDPMVLADKGVPMLKQAGCRKIGVVSTLRLLSNTYGSQLRARLGQAVRQAGVQSELWLVPLGKGNHSAIAAGRAVGLRLLDLPPDERPDGLVVLTDMLSLGLTQTLVDANYHPAIVAMTNLQIAMVFPLPVTQFELDLGKLADSTIRQIIQRLHKPQAVKEVVHVGPELGVPIFDPNTAPKEAVLREMF